MAKGEGLTQVQRLPRQGEGAVVELSRRQVTHPDGTTSLELNMDLALAPVPEKRYVADVASITYADDVLQILFGQKKIGQSDELRSLIVVQMTSTAARQFLKTLTTWEPGARKWAELNDIHAELTEVEKEPPQTVTLFANIVGLAFAGREACMDFYHASPFALHYVQQNKKMSVEPVVRVMLGTGLALALVDKIRDVSAKFSIERGLPNG
jgi:hypothetical protein